MKGVLGWDIGGVNTKAARVAGNRVVAVRAVPYEIQRDPAALAPLLPQLTGELSGTPTDAHGVTMTAELSQIFRTKRDGVAFVVEAVTRAFPDCLVRVYAVDGRWLTADEARREPLAVAAANWAAAARVVARNFPDCILIDVGSTTTDITAISGGVPAAFGRTDPERLREGELVYTGALRTPAEAIAANVPLGGRAPGVSAEGFALAGDVPVWRRQLAPADYTVATPDGRAATRELAGERLARVVCGDREILDEAAIDAIAEALWDAQVTRIAEAVGRARRRHPTLGLAVVTGLGDFLAAEAARRAGLRVPHLFAALGPAARHAPEVAAARQAGRLPVLAPYRWVRAADPLPHTWEITSDSIAAWIAGMLGARRIVLIKPAGGDPRKLVDPLFIRTLPPAVEHFIITADDLGQLDVALDEGRDRGQRRSARQG